MNPKLVKNEIVAEISGLPARDLKEVLDFVYFIKAKSSLDPSQSYFWTRQWQNIEAEAEEDKRYGRTIGKGDARDLLKELHKRNK